MVGFFAFTCILIAYVLVCYAAEAGAMRIERTRRRKSRRF